MNRRDIKVRLALDAEGPRVAELAATCGFTFSDWEIDWSNINPHWLVADHRGDLLGCLQVCYGRPVGRLEVLCIDKSLGQLTRALVVNLLLTAGPALLKSYGAQFASSIIPFDMKYYKRWLKRHKHIETIASGNMVLYHME